MWTLNYQSTKIKYRPIHFYRSNINHWGRVTHIRASKPTNVGSDNGLSPGRRQAIIWTNAGLLLTGLIGKNSSDICHRNSYIFNQKKNYLKLSSGRWRPFCLGLNVVMDQFLVVSMIRGGIMTSDLLALNTDVGNGKGVIKSLLSQKLHKNTSRKINKSISGWQAVL